MSHVDHCGGFQSSGQPGGSAPSQTRWELMMQGGKRDYEYRRLANGDDWLTNRWPDQSLDGEQVELGAPVDRAPDPGTYEGVHNLVDEGQ
jgi:hypothetical protein